MQIQINTDSNIEGHQTLTAHVTGVLESALSQISDCITRVEVHLSDENSDKGGPNDNRCALEARLEGRRPVAVTHKAATLDQAIHGAAEKLNRLIMSDLDQRRGARRHRTDPPPPGLAPGEKS